MQKKSYATGVQNAAGRINLRKRQSGVVQKSLALAAEVRTHTYQA